MSLMANIFILTFLIKICFDVVSFALIMFAWLDSIDAFADVKTLGKIIVLALFLFLSF